MRTSLILFITFTFIVSLTTQANDGVYMSQGGIIYPTKETSISLDKEVLSFTVRDRVAHVDIQFEFNNPETTARKLLIGFQAPSAAGDVPDSISTKNHIDGFIIIHNGVILPYELKAAECEDCELGDPTDVRFFQSETGVFVFLFEVTFEPGLNTIGHSYSFPASSSVGIDQFFGYILTTGSKWAGGKIDDLTVNIDMGLNRYFYVSDIFGSSADWSIVGTGKVTDETFDNGGTVPSKLIRTLSGHLQVKVSELHPTSNIEFGLFNETSFVSWLLDNEELQSGEVHSLRNLSLTDDYTKAELRLLRNLVFAQYGYAFKTPDLIDYFSQFAWYLPDPNLKMEDIRLTASEIEFVNRIKAKEAE